MRDSIRILHVDGNPEFAELTASHLNELFVEAQEWDISLSESVSGGARFEITGVDIVE